MMNITLNPAFIIHSRPYRETSLVLDILTESHGRVGMVAKGVRTSRPAWRVLLQPFVPLLISGQGNGDLILLTSAENQASLLTLKGEGLLAAFYLNELLARTLQKHDPHPRLYHVYQTALQGLQADELQESVLRIFEKHLLAELGYGLQLERDFSTGKELVADQFYQFYPEQGFKAGESVFTEKLRFKGASLRALFNERFDEDSLKEAKRLMRLAFASLLGIEALHSRKLFKEIHHD
jgi:DNA repair protein RecO (recombination protein O)